MNPKKLKVKRDIPPDQLNLSIHRQVLELAGDLVSAMIAEFICYRYIKNDKKKVFLKTDWIYEALPPYLSRAAIAKKLDKLTAGTDPLIIKEKGKGRYYHKCWYTPSKEVLEGYRWKEGQKVYYNKEMAAEHLEASVVYATIINLLKLEDGWWEKLEHGRDGEKLTLDTQKLTEGSGMTAYAIRRGVKWLKDNKRIETRKKFGNKLEVWLPKPPEPTTELTPHEGDDSVGDNPEDKTEY